MVVGVVPSCRLRDETKSYGRVGIAHQNSLIWWAMPTLRLVSTELTSNVQLKRRMIVIEKLKTFTSVIRKSEKAYVGVCLEVNVAAQGKENKSI